jgi:pimeloyl-ACP methyl ester carboxylesterase
MTAAETRTLVVPGVVLTYDVRPVPGGALPALFMIGSPMDASGFADLAARFPDRTVVTYDPRGTGRSVKADPGSESTPDQHADDLHRLIATVGGPVDVFASSGGAVNALALVARHPGQVRVLVAHEPPAAQVLPDRERALSAVEHVREVYDKHGFGPAMARFIALTAHRGEFPADAAADLPGPGPADLGMPAEDDGRRDDALLGQNLITCTHYEHDFDALRAASTRIVVGVGVETEGEMAHRGGLGVAERLGTAAVTFPSHHGGFLGDNPWMKGDPDGFAVTLRAVLAG